MSHEPASGRWNGWWRQGLREGHEALDLALNLTLGGGTLAGTGQDEDGTFSLSGQLYPDGTASLTKHYTMPLITCPARMSYIGQWDGRVIRGSWVDDRHPDNHGPFLLWPCRASEQTEAEESATRQEAGPQAEDLVRVRSLPGRAS